MVDENSNSLLDGGKSDSLNVMRCDDDYDDDYGDHECANCGGEGFIYGCSWDWQCDTYDEGEGTCLCTRRCEWCNPLTADELAERQKLRDVLASALADAPAETGVRVSLPVGEGFGG